MAYILGLLALLMNSIKGYCGKKTSGVINTFSNTILFTLARMIICISIGLFLIWIKFKTFSSITADSTLIIVSAISGIASAAFVVSWIVSIRTGSYMMVDVFLTLGVSIPLIACRIIYNEPLEISHGIGFVLLVFAAYVMSSYNKSIGKARLTQKSLILLALCGFSNGVNLFCQKFFNYECQSDIYTYNFYTYVFSSVALLIFWSLLYITKANRQTGEEKNKIPLLRLSVYVFLMAVCLFLNSLFTTAAAQTLTASQLYPFMQGGNLVFSMLMSAVFFKEGITKKSVFGCALTFLALLFINIF